jgi:predicted metallo-beta-lactamase superfamily hydrolase
LEVIGRFLLFKSYALVEDVRLYCRFYELRGKGVDLLKKIKVVPLAGESFGVRSTCTFVETMDVRVLLDAGVSLCPYRFGLPPHPIEFQTIDRLRKTIAEAADKSEVVTISHYHFDHHTPSFEDWFVNWTETKETARQIYESKIVLTKNPKDKINASQRHRAWLFQKTAGKLTSRLAVADGKEFKFGKNTTLSFSKAVPHGPAEASLGWVVILTIESDGERFMFAPDVQGPMATETVAIIQEKKPEVIMIGGPPFYLSNQKVSEEQLELALTNLSSVVETIPVTILEHHALRDDAWRIKTQKVFETASAKGHSVVTAASFVGTKDMLLESRRDKLFSENPPSKEFEKWMREDSNTKSHIKPPV